MTLPKFRGTEGVVFPTDPVPWAGLVLLALSTVMLVEAILAIIGPRQPPTRSGVPSTGGSRGAITVGG